MTEHTSFLAAAMAVSVLAGVIDWRTGRIPNWLTLPALALGLGARALHAGWDGLGGAAIGLIVASAVPWLLYRSTKGAGIGGGDVKLFAALGALLGGGTALELEFLAFGLLAVFALVRLAFLGRLLAVLGNVARLMAGPFVPSLRKRPRDTDSYFEMRMGPAIALATLSVALADYVRSALPWLV